MNFNFSEIQFITGELDNYEELTKKLNMEIRTYENYKELYKCYILFAKNFNAPKDKDMKLFYKVSRTLSVEDKLKWYEKQNTLLREILIKNNILRSYTDEEEN